MNRRDFLGHAAGATVTLILTPFAIAGCSSGSSSGSSTSTEPTLPGCDGDSETSSVTEGHTHAICIAAATLSSPPADGVTLPTTTTRGHAHTVALTQAQLQSVQAGRAVTVTTSVVESHTHGFTVQKGSTTTTPPPVTGPY